MSPQSSPETKRVSSFEIAQCVLKNLSVSAGTPATEDNSRTGDETIS